MPGTESLAPSPEQDRVIRASCRERLIVNAGPGRGKTFTLINRLKNLIEEQEVDPEEILVLSYSRAAVAVIKSRLEEAAKAGEITVAWQRLDLRTFDKFATWLLYQDAEYNSNDDLDSKKKKEAIGFLDYDSRIRRAASVAREWKGLFNSTAHVLIDETQDLVDPRTKLVLSILESLPSSCGFTLLGDSCQALYDYSVKEMQGAGTSSKMIARLEQEMTLDHFEFHVNYRQPHGLPYDAEKLRAAILSGSVESMGAAISDILENIETDTRDFRQTDFGKLSKLGASDSLGILTRTNGQALYVSSLLRNSGVPHAFRPSGFNPPLVRALADIFCSVDTATLNREEFVSLAVQHGIEETTAIDYWYGLVDISQNAGYGPRQEVATLLQGLLAGGRRSTLFLDPGLDASITVSTIHSSKGREFENVWILEEDLTRLEAGNKDVEEYRVAYVALTRPKSGAVLKRLGGKVKIKRFSDRAAGRKRGSSVVSVGEIPA